MRHTLPSFLLVTDAQRKPDPVPAVLALKPGDGLILRHYRHPGRADLARSLDRIARANRLVLLIAADLRLAASLRVSGIHLPEGLLRTGPLAPILGWARRNNRLITAACHNRIGLGKAGRLKLDAALLSPVFPTASHPGAKTLGLARFAALSRAAGLPVYGLGGMRKNTARAMMARTNACGVAGTIPLNTYRQAGKNPS